VKGIFALEKNRLGILELDIPVIGDYEALVEVYSCGICNSTDWKIIEGRFKKGPFPILLGHESYGKVVQVGRKVKSYKECDMVLRSRLYDKDISLPEGSSRFGGFAQKAVVTDVWAQKGVGYNSFPHPQQIVPKSINHDHAPVMIVLKENLNTVHNTDIRAGHSLAIVGTGPASQSMVMWAKVLGVSPVVVFGRRSKWSGRFSYLGADAYVTGDEFPPEINRIMKNGGFDRVIEAVGSNEALSMCLEIVKKDGKVHLYGMPADDVPYESRLESDPRIFRTKVAEAEVHDELLGYIEDGKVDLEDWVNQVCPLNEYQKAFEMVRDEKPTKIIIKMKE
jgi:D-arabinose 1-dehydrogenase-like Zn-dependent alcohol dehydrogenase